MAGLRAAGNLVDELSSTVVLADMWLAAGRPRRARGLCERALQRAAAAGGPRATADLHVGLSKLDREAVDLAGARRHLETAAALAEPASTTEGRYRWFVAMGRLVDAEGDPEAALDLLDQGERHYLLGYFPDVWPIPAMKARIRIAQGELAEAADWARERCVSATDDVGYLSEFDHLTLVRLLIARHRADQNAGRDTRHDTGPIGQAVRLLDRLLEAAETSGRAGSRVEIRMLQALAHDAQGDRTRARETLGRAWAEVPEPTGYARLFQDEGAHMTRLLRDAEHHDVAADHARRVLGLDTTPEPGAPDVGHRAVASSGLLTERELQVLRLLDSELNGPEIARELFVSHNTLRTHTKHIFTKLEVTNRRAAIRRARERGLL